MAPQIVTANRLSDGRVVYLTAAGGWTEQIAGSRICDDEVAGEDAMAIATAAVDARQVVEPYLIDVDASAGVTPVRYREVIRAGGPSITETGE